MILTINKTVIRVVIVAVIVGVGAFITVIANPGDSKTAPSADAPSLNDTINNAVPVTLKKSGEMGSVTVDVQPKTLAAGEDKTVFAVAFNTHSVELDFDFTEIISLQDDLGNAYPAEEWTGNSGWHHVNGDIVFPAINSQATSVTLTISTIEGQTQQFSWAVQK